MCKPPAATTWSCSACQPLSRAEICACFCCSLSVSSARMASIWCLRLPPKTISVPRPAILVATVIAPTLPAWATINASRSCSLAFRTLCGRPASCNKRETSSEFSMLVVPTKTGWPFLWHSAMSLTTASNFSSAERKIWSLKSLRCTGRLVGMMTVSRL